jgi:hypothetical protein
VPACKQRGLKEETRKISCQSKPSMTGHERRSPDQLRKGVRRELEESASSEPRVTDRMVEVRLESSAEQVASLTVSSERIGQLSNTDVLGRHRILFILYTGNIEIFSGCYFCFEFFLNVGLFLYFIFLKNLFEIKISSFITKFWIFRLSNEA